MRFKTYVALGGGCGIKSINHLKSHMMVRDLLRALGDEAGRIWEGSLEATCVLAVGRIPRGTWREETAQFGDSMKGRASGVRGSPDILLLDPSKGENDDDVNHGPSDFLPFGS